MDIGQLALEHALQGGSRREISPEAANEVKDEQRKRVARDFESLFIHQMLSQMKNTIPESDLMESGASRQIQDMYWSFLSKELGQQGGFGLWETIYEQMKEHDGSAEKESLQGQG